MADRWSISYGSRQIGQFTVPGIAAETESDKLKAKAARPLRSAKPQRPADFGLFDLGARAQLDIADLTREEE